MPPAVMTNSQLRKYLEGSLEIIDMKTADESVLSTLSSQRKSAATAATNLERKASKRKVSEMLNSYSYGDAEGSYYAVHAAKEALFRVEKEKWEAIHYPAGSKELEQKLEEDAKSLERRLSLDAGRRNDMDLMDARELKLVKFFHEHCTQIDTKSAEIASVIPGYSPVMQAEVVTKKSPPPTTAEVQAALGFAFREPDCVDKVALHAKLNAQLADTDKITKKLNKTIETRDTKLQKRPVSNYEKRYNKGIRKLWENEAMRDNSDRDFAHWFKQHSVSIKAKIASIGCGA
jgi:hypothetical protein